MKSRTDVEVKKAINLEEGDEIVGSAGEVLNARGIVELITVVDRGVQILYVDGTTLTRPEDHDFYVTK